MGNEVSVHAIPTLSGTQRDTLALCGHRNVAISREQSLRMHDFDWVAAEFDSLVAPCNVSPSPYASWYIVPTLHTRCDLYFELHVKKSRSASLVGLTVRWQAVVLRS